MTKSELTGHELYATYHSHYWREDYKVMEIHSNGFVTVYWLREKRYTTHCTNVWEDKKVA